ncbi:phospholipase D-like domain-containing protein [Bdellovibrio sp. HCB337]|uniref:phospholipase D-like domain-containing protein n=1 Tax=Bdellovibrio sp. HCB337 TaxID=3394358 RepID=UPI0039A5F995
MFMRTMGLLLVSALSTQALAAEKEIGHSRTTGRPLESFLVRSQEPQQMSIYNTGVLSFQKRLEMIASAKKSIEVEFFIYNIDNAGRLFTQALVKKAKEGVKVRVLVDYGWPIAQLDNFYATLLVQNGVEVRYYNPMISFELFKGQFRSHRKALIIDDVQGMTGGRNIADEYFDMATDYNFLDRDIVVRGSMAKSMRQSFDQFWDSEMTEQPTIEKEPKIDAYNTAYANVRHVSQGQMRFKNALARYSEGMKKANAYLVQTAQDREILEATRAASLLSSGSIREHTCTDSIFAADMPGIGNRSRVLFQEINRQILSAQKSVHVESPYFVTTIEGMGIINKYLERGVEMNVYTNSLNSTDATYTTATLYPRVGFLIENGLNVFIYRGQSIPSQDMAIPEAAKARWGLHAKSAVIDDKITMVGTFNVDPRSRNINSEMALMCLNSPGLASDVLASMRERRDHSVQLNKDGEPVDGSSRFHGTSIPKRISYYLMLPFANIFSYLL